MKYLCDKDVASGLMFLALGILGLGLSQQFDFGTTARPGPGFFPTVLSVLLMLIGGGVTVAGLLRPVVNTTQMGWRPFVYITLAVVVFALSIDRFGLVPSVLATSIIASFAKSGFGLAARLVTSAALALFSAILFIGLLGLPIELWSF
jgi:hypothetical protein